MPWLCGDLAWNGICASGVFPWLGFAGTEPAAGEDQRDLDEEPERHQGDESAEWDGGAGRLGPDKQIEDEDHPEEQTGEEEGGLPLRQYLT